MEQHSYNGRLNLVVRKFRKRAQPFLVSRGGERYRVSCEPSLILRYSGLCCNWFYGPTHLFGRVRNQSEGFTPLCLQTRGDRAPPLRDKGLPVDEAGRWLEVVRIEILLP